MPREKSSHFGGEAGSLHPVVNGFRYIEIDIFLETALLKGTEARALQKKTEGVCRNGNLVRNAGECVLEVLSEEIFERQKNIGTLPMYWSQKILSSIIPSPSKSSF
ncbi:MAG: hypothetical protein EGQ34_03755 [Sutterella sp.]|nr:hypothetical protein [Sutterella sp.]